MESRAASRGLYARIVVVMALCLAVCCVFSAQQAYGEDLKATDFKTQSTKVANQDMYRLYNMNSGEHLYTANKAERNNLVGLGWFYEGIAWLSPVKSSTPVYRLYNPNSGDHHYTTSAKERDWLVPFGWKYEGIAWYSDDQKRRPIYRTFNPNAVVGTHHYTEAKAEVSNLASIGWHDEGLGWYGSGAGRADSLPLNINHWQALLSHAPTGGGITLNKGSINAYRRNGINALIDTPNGIGFIAINRRTGQVISRNADYELFSASSVKAPYMAAVCKYDAPGIAGWRGTMANIVATSDNNDYAALSGHYGKGYLQRFANESGVALDLGKYASCYVDYTPRKLCKLWTTIATYMYSNQKNAAMYRSFYGEDVYKMGWMTAGAWSGIIHNIAGVKGDVVYAILSREPSKTNLFHLRNHIVAAVE